MSMIITQESSWRTHSIEVEDYKTLLQFYSQSVPFKGTSGKYFISSSIIYPRYKVKAAFEIFNQTNPSNKKSIAKNEGYADYVIMPCRDILKVLKESRVGKNSTGKEVCMFMYIHPKHLAILKMCINYYNTYKDKPMIDFKEFSESIDGIKERLTINNTEVLVNLGRGDSGSQKLCMEMLTNYDVSKSLVAILYVLSRFSNIRYNEYYNSTVFKAFRTKMREITGYDVDWWAGMEFPRLYQKLLIKVDEFKDITMTKSEYNYIKDLMLAECKKVAEGMGVTLNIDSENVTLRIGEANIIEDSVVEEADRVRLEALMEDPNEAYILVDDTIENS